MQTNQVFYSTRTNAGATFLWSIMRKNFVSSGFYDDVALEIAEAATRLPRGCWTNYYYSPVTCGQGRSKHTQGPSQLPIF